MRWGVAMLLLLLLGACDESLDRQNRLKTYGSAETSANWPGTSEALPLVAGTVAQGDLERARQVAEPPPVSLALLHDGRLRYDAYCAPCHGLTGAGDGIIVGRGFPKPP